MTKHYFLIISILLNFNISIIPGTVKIVFNDSAVIDCEFSYIPYCYGDQEKCEIAYFSSNGRWERYYCKIPLPDFLFEHHITNATLSIFRIQDTLSSTDTSFQLAINRLSDPMTGFYERTIGNDVTPPSYYPSPIYSISDTISGDYEGWINFPVDTLVQGWLDGTYSNDGFLIRMKAEGSSDFTQRIIICQSSFNDSSKRPILTITGDDLPDTLIQELPTSVNTGFNNMILSYILEQNYPNPFNPTTTISYQIQKRGFVSLKVYDILGKEVATLVNEEKPAGSYTVQVNGENLSSGIYFYKLSVSALPSQDRQTGNYISVKKMILIK